ncbi:ankyrin [Parathielavia appendiculata]|uniref:Ankyrin n=1 Tax=Parathielavia appendiculata TaxID=2587402 RepID=A0AAN6TSA9_9PEZI|nr:ankyrin [Parathielavia appendiculata]
MSERTIFEAARHGDCTRLQQLLDDGKDLDVRDSNGRTALSWAAEGENMEVVRWLLAKKVDVNVKDSKGRTALFWAVKERGRAIGAVKERRRATGPFRAAGAGFGSRVEPADETVGELLLRDNRTIVDSTDNDGRTALLWAVEKGDLVIVEELLKREDVNVNIKDNNGRTALSRAAEGENMEVVRWLLAKKVDVNAKDSKGRTALFWAVKETGRATWSFRAAGAGFGSGVEPRADGAVMGRRKGGLGNGGRTA